VRVSARGYSWLLLVFVRWCTCMRVDVSGFTWLPVAVRNCSLLLVAVRKQPSMERVCNRQIGPMPTPRLTSRLLWNGCVLRGVLARSPWAGTVYPPRLLAGYIMESRLGYNQSQSQLGSCGRWLLDAQMDPKTVSKSVTNSSQTDPKMTPK